MCKVAIDSEVQSCLDRFVEERRGLYSYSLEWRGVTVLEVSSMSHPDLFEH